MRFRTSGLSVLSALVVVALSAESASACTTCHATPCAYVAPQPAYECVTEMVPYTVMKTRKRIDWQPVVKTVMEKVPHTTYVDRQRVVCKTVYDTQYVTRQRVVCKPVYDTQYVTQTYTTCRPETTTQQVTEICMQPYTQVVAVKAKGKCHFGHFNPACACPPQTAYKTCYQPVPVVKNVTVTRMVPEVQTRQVPVTSCRMVQEVVNEQVPVTTCRKVQEVVIDKVPHTTYTCEPRQVTKHVPVPVCETVPVTKYKKVKRMVPVSYAAPAPVTYGSPQAPLPTGQSFGGAASGQG